MRLFLHAGTEKTGSSHIQTLCVNGRHHLEQEGIWFPEGIPRHEKRMRAGLVSAGNAFVIAERARGKDDAGALAELLRHRETAQSRDCRAVFLTSELLLPYCANDGAWQGLFEMCRQAGFDNVSTLVVLRDPVDQLISLYKHRARSGTAGRLDEWIDEDYRLPDALARLREQARVNGRELIARGYTREPGGLESIIFGDWLGITEPPLVHENEVNPSLSLSELELIRRMAETRPALVNTLYAALVAVDSEQKVRGKALESYARAVAAHTVAGHADEWRAWNRLLPSDERLNVPEPVTALPPRPKEVGFGDKQLTAIAQVLEQAATPRFIAGLFWRSRIRPMLGRVKRAVLRM